VPKRLLILMLACLGLVAGATTSPARAASTRPLVLAIRLDSEINPVSASFVEDSISRAEATTRRRS